MDNDNHYATLGVSPGATAGEIGAAYGSALAEFRRHVEQGSPLPPQQLDRLHAAYKTLIDPVARAAYDAAAGAPQSAPPATPPAGPPMASPGASSPAAANDSHRFRFTGSGGEYFRIWIVNLLLSVITLGIYSAWAKVRREQYFHRNLLLDDAGFDYHGRPLAILKGRAIAFGLLVLLSIAGNIGPVVHGLAVLALLPAVPWLVVRALRFRAHNTSYRGLRFSFHGGYRDALVTFVGYGLLTLVSFGLLFPLFYRKQRKFVLDNLRYGTAPFGCEVTVWAFYKIFIVPVLVILGSFFALGFLGAIGGKAVAAAMFGLGTLAYLAFLLVLVPYIHVRTTNLVWNNTRLEAGQFVSSMTVWSYFKLAAGNLALLIVTIGLFWPWAKVRVARYRADHMHLAAAAPLDEFIAGEATKASALGDEVSELFDVDIAL